MFQGGRYTNVRDTKGTRYWYVSNPELLLDKPLQCTYIGEVWLATFSSIDEMEIRG